MKYNPEDWTWGYEIEWGDISRNILIPERLGKWEYAETDIVNERPPYRGVACDPLGVKPPVGGEINTRPTKTIKEQIKNIEELRRIFWYNEQYPTSSCVNHGHLHVFIPGLKDDIDSLKKLIRYVKENQHVVIDKCYQFRIHPDMSMAKTAKTYLKWDGGRPMPDYMCDNIIKLANNFEDFIRLHAAGKDGVSMGRPFRYAINTYCMKHTGTIEFRCFRSSVKTNEILSCFNFVKAFMDAALNDGSDVMQLLMEGDYTFPPFIYDHELYTGWENTKYDKSRGEKKREFIPI